MIEVDGLTFGYRRGDPIIDRLTAHFPPATITVVTGPSGRGKSTLLYLLGLMVQPWSGTVGIDGQPVGSLSDHDRATRRASLIGFVFQDGCLDPSRSVIDNVLEGCAYTGAARAP